MNIREWVIFELIFFRKIPRSETAGWYAVQLAVFLRTSILFYRRRQWQPTPVLLPGESHGWRSLVGCSPWDREESDTAERLRFHFSLSCFGEGNGNPLQCSCLENPRDGGAWWAAVSGVAKSRTQLNRLSSSSSILFYIVAAPVYTSTKNARGLLFYHNLTNTYCFLSFW